MGVNPSDRKIYNSTDGDICFGGEYRAFFYKVCQRFGFILLILKPFHEMHLNSSNDLNLKSTELHLPFVVSFARDRGCGGHLT